MRRAFTLVVRWMSKRARVHDAKATATAAAQASAAAKESAARATSASASASSSATAAAPAAADATAEIVLWRCNKQMQARLLVMAAFAQLLLGVAYFDSLWLVKKKEAEHQMLQELREGFADAKLKSPFHYLSTMDKVLGCAIAGAPILLLVSSRFSTGRWVHEIKLVSKTQAAVQTYNLFAQRVTRVMPLSNIVRLGADSDRILINDKTFLLPKGGEMLDKAVFERSFRMRT